MGTLSLTKEARIYNGEKIFSSVTGVGKTGQLCLSEGLPDGSVGKESACKAGDPGDAISIPELGRCLSMGHGHPRQCSCLENPMLRGAWELL